MITTTCLILWIPLEAASALSGPCDPNAPQVISPAIAETVAPTSQPRRSRTLRPPRRRTDHKMLGTNPTFPQRPDAQTCAIDPASAPFRARKREWTGRHGAALDPFEHRPEGLRDLDRPARLSVDDALQHSDPGYDTLASGENLVE